MKKLLMSFVLIAAGLVALGTPVYAQTTGTSQPFAVSVDIPPASSATFVLWKLTDGAAFPKTPQADTNILWSKSDMTLTNVSTTSTPQYIFLSPTYYAIDVFPSGGSGGVNVAFTYADTANPNGGTTDGLGTKAIATAVSVNPANNNETDLFADTLYNIASHPLTAATIDNSVGGHLRLYVGLSTGETGEPSGAVPFNPGDASGNYTGTLKISVTAA